MVREPRDPWWRRFCTRYVEHTGFWYVPKGEAVNDLPRIQSRLSLLLDKFQGEPWRTAQLGYVNELKRKGLFVPRARGQGDADRAAIARMVKVVFDTLGLAWVDQDDAVYVSSTGSRFIESSNPEEIVRRQLWKYQFWNPAVRGDQYQEFRIFPYPFLLEVLLEASGQLTPEEYNLFTCRAKTPDQVGVVRAQIERWRKLDEKAREQVISYLESVATESAKTEDKVSLYTRIARVQPYAWALFSSSSAFIERTRTHLRIRQGKEASARKRVEKHRANAAFIEFENEKEWFSYYGDAEVDSSYRTAMSVYEARYDVARAVEALRGARERSLVDASLTDDAYVDAVVHEKVIEDILEHHLGHLEKGLTLYREGDVSGRQFQTERGIIDLLARDDKGNWIVIELKKARAGDKVLGQTLRYVGWVRDNRLQAGEEVRGYIVGKTIDPNLLSAARGAHPVPIKLFEFDFRLRVELKYPATVSRTGS